jgi:hypothetical protein
MNGSEDELRVDGAVIYVHIQWLSRNNVSIPRSFLQLSREKTFFSAVVVQNEAAWWLFVCTRVILWKMEYTIYNKRECSIKKCFRDFQLIVQHHLMMKNAFKLHNALWWKFFDLLHTCYLHNTRKLKLMLLWDWNKRTNQLSILCLCNGKVLTWLHWSLLTSVEFSFI